MPPGPGYLFSVKSDEWDILPGNPDNDIQTPLKGVFNIILCDKSKEISVFCIPAVKNPLKTCSFSIRPDETMRISIIKRHPFYPGPVILLCHLTV